MSVPSRRAARVAAVTAGVLVAAACSSGTTATAPAPAATTAAAAPASTPASAVPGAPIQKTVDAANAFLATLSDDEKKTVSFAWTDTAQKQKWSNFPNVAFQRAGLEWGDLTTAQQDAWLAIEKASLSTEGYDRLLAEWGADDANAKETGQSDIFGKQFYLIALIGTPSATGPWMWQFGGHHVTINAAVTGGRISIAPSFIGDQPASYQDANGNTVRPLGDIEDESFALVNSLDPTQKQAAVLGTAPINLVLGPGEDGKTIAAEGVPLAQLTPDQQAAALKLIGHYTGIVDDADAKARLDEVRSTLDRTTFAWYGPTTAGQPAYFRFTGPTLVIEYSPQGAGGGPGGGGGQGGPPSGGAQPSGAPQGGGAPEAEGGAAIANATTAHIHGIYRDPTNEYGAKYAS